MTCQPRMPGKHRRDGLGVTFSRSSQLYLPGVAVAAKRFIQMQAAQMISEGGGHLAAAVHQGVVSCRSRPRTSADSAASMLASRMSMRFLRPFTSFK